MNSSMSTPDSSENKQANLRVTDIAIIVLAGFFVVLRCVARWQRGAYISSDDYTILLAFVSGDSGVGM